MKTLLLIAIAAALLSGCSKPAPAAPSPAPSAPASVKWQYKTIEVENYEHQAAVVALSELQTNTEAGDQDLALSSAMPGNFYFLELDKLGNDGWELVAAIPQIETQEHAKMTSDSEPFSNIRTGKIILIFKRPSP